MAVTTGKLTRVTQEEVDQEAQEHRKLREMNIANKNKYKYNLLMKRKARNQAEVCYVLMLYHLIVFEKNTSCLFGERKVKR